MISNLPFILDALFIIWTLIFLLLAVYDLGVLGDIYRRSKTWENCKTMSSSQSIHKIVQFIRDCIALPLN